VTTGIFFRWSLPEEIGWAEGFSAIAPLLYRETAVISTVDRGGAVQRLVGRFCETPVRRGV
jgi:hypothetical protein